MKILFALITVMIAGCTAYREKSILPSNHEIWTYSDYVVPVYHATPYINPPIYWEESDNNNYYLQQKENKEDVKKSYQKKEGNNPITKGVSKSENNDREDNSHLNTTTEIPKKDQAEKENEQNAQQENDQLFPKNSCKTEWDKEKLRQTLHQMDAHIEQSNKNGWKRFDYENNNLDFLKPEEEN